MPFLFCRPQPVSCFPTGCHTGVLLCVCVFCFFFLHFSFASVFLCFLLNVCVCVSVSVSVFEMCDFFFILSVALVKRSEECARGEDALSSGGHAGGRAPPPAPCGFISSEMCALQ